MSPAYGMSSLLEPAVTKRHRWGGLAADVYFRASSSCKSKIKVSAGWFLLGPRSLAADLCCVLTWPFLCVPTFLGSLPPPRRMQVQLYQTPLS